MKLSELSAKLSGCHLEGGDTDPDITGIAAIDRAKVGDLTFVSSPKYLPLLQTTQASAVIIDFQSPCPLPCLRTANPRLLFAQALTLFYQPLRLPIGIHATAILGENVQLGKDVAIGAGVVVGNGVVIGDRVSIFANTTIYPNVTIGNDTTIHSNCVIREDTQIGASCLIHAGVAIGNDGFGFELQPDGNWYKIPQTGTVIIEEKVEIGALTAIDRPAVGITRIGTGTKVDNLVQIGHGCQIGPHSILVAQVGLAGGASLGHHVVLAGQVGVADHAAIGDGAVVGAKSGVISYVEAGTKAMGYPTVSERDWKRMIVAEKQLPDLIRTVSKLEKRIAELEAKLGEDA